MMHPHKQNPEIIQSDLDPERFNQLVNEQNIYYSRMFQTEKQQAFRDIEELLKSAPLFMFIKGTLSEPKCKFTRKLVETLAPFKYRGVKTLNILENERIRQWLKFYSNWPTFPQVFVDGKLVGGVDIVCDLVSEGEFDAMLPSSCKPLPPKEAFSEFLDKNKIVVVLQGD